MPAPSAKTDGELSPLGYSPIYRKVEVAAITAFFVMIALSLFKLAPHVGQHPGLVLASFIGGYVGADFVCGFFHWGADTWGTSRTILIGNALIRPFREHHVDPKGMTRHDFIETNGTNCLMSLAGFVLPFAIPLDPGDGFRTRLAVVAFVVSLLVSVMATNQIHKWAHSDRPPRLVVALQRLHLILPPEHHAIHHASPFVTYYCITSGWLNWVLTQTRFFRILEAAITDLLGWKTRQDEARSSAPDTMPGSRSR